MSLDRSRSNAQANDLFLLGVADRVTNALMANPEVDSVGEVACRVVVKDGGVFIVASYIKRFKPGGVRSTKPHRDVAYLRVGLGQPFGPIGSAPLPDTTVEAIYAMVGMTA